MNIFTRQTTGLLLLITASCNVQAFTDDNNNIKKHSFGTHLAAGGVEYKGSNSKDNGVVQLYSYYNYAINNYFSLEFGLNVGTDVDDWECNEVSDNDWHCSNTNNNLFGQGIDEVDYRNLVAAVKGTLPLSKRNSLFTKVGVQQYDYDMYRKNRLVADDSGTGLYLSAGWQYRWDFGLGMEVGYEVFDMGDLDTYTLNTGISYQF